MLTYLSTQWYTIYNRPPLGMVPWRSSSLGYAKKGRVGRLSRRPSGHGGCSVPMKRWTNASGSIDWHLLSAWKVLYKRVYPRLKAGNAINASIPMHGEGCMPQAAALRMSLSVPARNKWTKWMSAPHDCDMCLSNVREEPIDRLSLEWGSEWTGVWNLLRDTAKPPQLDGRLSFGEHLQTATAKDIQCGAALTRLMPNISGPREAKSRLVVSVV